MGDQWHYTRSGKQVGPISGTELKQFAASGHLLPTDTVWKDGMGAWAPASSVKGLFNSNLSPPPLPASPPATPDARRDPDSDYNDRDDYGRAPSRGARSGGAHAIAAITASEFGISSTMLGAITLIGQLYPLIGALAAGRGEMGGVTLMLVAFLLLSGFAGFLGVMGIIIAIRKGQAGGIYSMVGIIVSTMAFISSIIMLLAVSSATQGGRFK